MRTALHSIVDITLVEDDFENLVLVQTTLNNKQIWLMIENKCFYSKEGDSKFVLKFSFNANCFE